MMNKLISYLLFILLPTAISAQNYTVYSVIGNVRIIDGKKSIPLQPRKLVKEQTKLHLGTECAITLLDEKNHKMYSLSAEGTYTVDQLLEKTNGKAKSISKQYMSYLIKQLFSDTSQKMLHPDTYMQVTATSYRSASNDSMLLSRIAQCIPQIAGTTIEQQLCSFENEIQSDLKVHFELISCDTGFALEQNVKGNTGSYVRVHNDTEDALYVNVLDIDEKGNKYLVLPMDEAASCAHLLVPAKSTVSFKSEPFIFSEEPMKETFILIATQDPVDFSILMSPIRNNGNMPMRSGLYKHSYQVQR